MSEDSQLEGAEEDFQRWRKEIREYEIGIRDEPPRIFDHCENPEDLLSKIKAIFDWLGKF